MSEMLDNVLAKVSHSFCLFFFLFHNIFLDLEKKKKKTEPVQEVEVGQSSDSLTKCLFFDFFFLAVCSFFALACLIPPGLGEFFSKGAQCFQSERSK